MVTIIAIILADVIVAALFIYEYRQELALTVNGSHDAPVLRKKPPRKETTPAHTANDQQNRGRQIVTRPQR